MTTATSTLPDTINIESNPNKKQELPHPGITHSILKGRQEQAATSETSKLSTHEQAVSAQGGSSRRESGGSSKPYSAPSSRPSASQLPKLPKPQKFKARNVFGGKGWSGSGAGAEKNLTGAAAGAAASQPEDRATDRSIEVMELESRGG
eukprot:764111-Hanusia_phi.AAC.1